MDRLTDRARALYHNEMSSAKTAESADQRWYHLERAHILSQPFPWLHTRNHAAMLNLALSQHDRHEALGQLVRIVVAAAGSLTGHYPDGNTGRVAAGLMTPMPIPDDLAAALFR